MTRQSAILLALTLLLPVAVPVAIAWRMESAISQSPHFHIPITSAVSYREKHDKRIAFDYNWNWQPKPLQRPDKTTREVLCITGREDAKKGPEVNLGDQDCRARIIGRYHAGDAGGQLFVKFRPKPDDWIDDEELRTIAVPVTHFQAISDILLDHRAHVTVKIAVTRDHKAKLLSLYLDGQTPDDYFKGKP